MVALLSIFSLLSCAGTSVESKPIPDLVHTIEEIRLKKSDQALRNSEIEFEAAMQALETGDWLAAKRYLDVSLAELGRELEDSLNTGDSVSILNLNERIIKAYTVLAPKLSLLGEDVTSHPATDYEIAPIVELDSAEDASTIDSAQIGVIGQVVDTMDMSQFSLPVQLNDRVLREIHLLTKGVAEFTKGSLSRMTMYEAMIHAKLAERNMPADLIYLSFVESGFKVRAYSPAKASGLWQFIPATGLRYGLKVDSWIDMRRNPDLATDAALSYLSDLYKEFGDWLMAMAAYNCGEGRVRRIKREMGEGASFWDMKLPKETMHYVPRILAASIIGHHSSIYGYSPEKLERLPVDTISVFHAIPLSLIAEAVDVSEEVIKDLNMELLRGVTPPTLDRYLLKLPQGSRDRFAEAYEGWDKSQFKSWMEHRVKKGETLSKIARLYGISVKEIQQANNLKKNKLKKGQVLTIPQVSTRRSTTTTEEMPEDKGSEKPKAQKSKGRKHTVRSGENLSAIARKYGVSVQDLREWNFLQDDKIRIGMQLRLTEPTAEKEVETTQGKSKSSLQESAKKHTIEQGDTYFSLSQKYGVSLNDLMSLNDARDGKLALGQIVFIPNQSNTKATSIPQSTKAAQGSEKGYHIVRSGDNLSSIANDHGISVANLQLWNGLGKKTALQIGEKLRLSAPPSDKRTTRASGKFYVIRKGDTLWDIARRHGVSVQELKEWNEGLEKKLQPGMKIQVGK